MELLLEIVQTELFGYMLAILISVIVTHFVEKSIWLRLIRTIITFLAEALEDEEINLPVFIEKLIVMLHSSDFETEAIEHMLEDEKIKKQ